MRDARTSVLVADDEQGLRDLARFVLEPLGYEVTTACNGLEAVEQVRRRAFDLVILDVHMPVLRGPEALRAIRALRPEQKVVVVSSSSDIDLEFERSAAQAGALECLFKPMSLDELTAVIERNVGQASRMAG